MTSPALGSTLLPRPGIGSRRIRDGSLERALLVILALAVLLGVVQLGVGRAYSDVFWPVCAFTVVFGIWVAAGLVAWWRRPANGVGPLIALGGVAVFLAGLANLPVPAFAVINSVFATCVLAVTVHLLHAFPSGRLSGRTSVVTVALGYAVAVGLDVVLTVVPEDRIGAVAALQRWLGIIVMVVTAAVLVHRLVGADHRHRRVLLPLYAYGIVSVLLVPLVPVVVRAAGVDPVVSGVVQLAILAGLPLAFLVGVLMGGYRRTSAIEAFSAWLAIGGASRPAVGRALSAALGDDSLQVTYWLPERGAYVDEGGSPVDPDERGADRGWVDVRVDGRLVGAIDYDARLIGDPTVVRRSGEILAIAIDRERLTAELFASNDELTRSRLRLVEVALHERSRIARDLHDGLQVQLVLLALQAQTIASLPGAPPSVSAAAEDLRRGIDAAAADLRNLVHNVLPASLVEQGLASAAEELIDRLTIPASLDTDVDESGIPAAVAHTAYLVLAELLSNAVKHSQASAVAIRLHHDAGRLVVEVDDDGVGGARVEHGTGLRGLGDRVAAVDGSVDVRSEPGAGTRVRVVLPCA